MPARSVPHALLLLVLALGAVACAAAAPRAASAAPPGPTALPTQLVARVDVGGYALQIACFGTGAPTIVIEDALGVATLESGNWWPIIQGVDAAARICIYDRAGLGFSDPPRLTPRTSQDAVEDLHRLLDGAHVPAPYILVGHAVGGLHALLYASQFPDEVVGMMLINSAHPNEWARLQALLPAETLGESARVTWLRTLPAHPANNAEALDLIASAAQVRAVLDSDALAGAAPPLGDLPLVVLSRSPAARPPLVLPPEIAQPGTETLRALQADLAGLSSSSIHLLAARAGLNIHRDEPELVIDGILQLLDELETPLS